MASYTISNPEANSSQSSRESKRKRKRKTGAENDSVTKEQLKTDKTRWRTLTEQQIYSSKLIDALHQVRRNNYNSTTNAPSIGCRTVRETADRVLAVAAKGRTRWSRAILLNRLRFRMKMMRNKHKKNKKVRITGDTRSKKPLLPPEDKKLPVLQRKVKVLGRLIPGCRKLSFPNLLEETTDYIAALEMQVRALAAISSLLTGAGVSLAAPPTSRLGSNMS